MTDIKGVGGARAHTAGLAKAGRQAPVSAGSGGARGARAAPSSGDSVRITGTAVLLQRAESSLAEVPVVDAGRVEAVRDSVSSGSFRIRPARIAEKLMQFERLIGRFRFAGG